MQSALETQKQKAILVLILSWAWWHKPVISIYSKRLRQEDLEGSLNNLARPCLQVKKDMDCN